MTMMHVPTRTDNIYNLTSAVVTLSRITFRVFIGEDGAVIDFYLECAKANGFGDDRDAGIDIGLAKSPEHKLPKIASYEYDGDWASLENSPEAPCQGFF